jgi:cell wall-associated NlpC family hydrolase
LVLRGFPLVAFIVMLVVALVGAPSAVAQSTGGTTYESEKERREKAEKRFKIRAVPGAKATLMPNGLAAAPVDAPPQVHAASAAANRIIGKPYKYGGGHAKVEDSGYDCSGTVSYALIHAKLLKAPLDSSSFMRWGEAGPGDWITVYTNPGHAFVVIAGLRLDTSAAGDPRGGKGPRWRPVLRSTRGFKARHPEGL